MYFQTGYMHTVYTQHCDCHSAKSEDCAVFNI